MCRRACSVCGTELFEDERVMCLDCRGVRRNIAAISHCESRAGMTPAQWAEREGRIEQYRQRAEQGVALFVG